MKLTVHTIPPVPVLPEIEVEIRLTRKEAETLRDMLCKVAGSPAQRLQTLAYALYDQLGPFNSNTFKGSLEPK